MATIHIIYLSTLFITALVALFAIKKSTSPYWPMLIFLISIFLLETLQFFFATNDPVFKALMSIQYLAEAFLICWQMKRWGVFERKGIFFLVMLALLIAAWIIDKLYGPVWNTRISWFKVIYSFTITLMAIEVLNKRLFTDRAPLSKNTMTLFSIGLILFYFFSGLLEVFMIIGQFSRPDIVRTFYILYIILGVITNFVYLRSVLCIPKTNYSLS